MTEPREEYLLYLGNCYARGWTTTKRGMKAFLHQRAAGWRNRKTGQMIWPGEEKETSEMEKLVELLDALDGVTLIKTESYRRLAEDRVLQKLRAENLQRKNKDLIDEVDLLRDKLEKAEEAKKNEQLATNYWYEECQKAKQELADVLEDLGVEVQEQKEEALEPRGEQEPKEEEDVKDDTH